MAGSLAHSTLISLIANVMMAASNWLLLIIIAKFWDATTLGFFVISLSLLSPALMFSSFKIRTLLVVDREWSYSLSDYATARIFASICAISIVWIINSFSNSQVPFYILFCVTCYKVFDATSEFCLSYLRRYEKFFEASCSLGLRAFLSTVSVLLLAWFDMPLSMVLAGWVMSTASIAIYECFRVYRLHQFDDAQINGKADVWDFPQALKRSLSLYKNYFTVALALFVSALFVYLPNFQLNYYGSIEEAGVFASLSYFWVAGGVVVNSLSQVATPRLSVFAKDNKSLEFWRLLKNLLLLGALLGFCGLGIAAIAGEWFLAIFYNNQIASFSTSLIWVMAAAGIRYLYIFIGTALASIKAFHIQTKLYSIGLLTMGGAGVVLIPKYGVLGASQAMLLATTAELVLFFIFGVRCINQHFANSREVIA